MVNQKGSVPFEYDAIAAWWRHFPIEVAVLMSSVYSRFAKLFAVRTIFALRQQLIIIYIDVFIRTPAN